jgi:hypothetical protein
MNPIAGPDRCSIVALLSWSICSGLRLMCACAFLIGVAAPAVAQKSGVQFGLRASTGIHLAGLTHRSITGTYEWQQG